MIIDKIENAELYSGINERFGKAFAFLTESDFSQIPPGKFELKGEEIFAILSEYETQNPENSELEGHKKYIDIHFMILGSEKIGVSTLYDQSPTKKYDPDGDFHLFEDQMYYLQLNKGMFAIFFSDDLHLPGIKVNEVKRVKKVVVKVRC